MEISVHWSFTVVSTWTLTSKRCRIFNQISGASLCRHVGNVRRSDLWRGKSFHPMAFIFFLSPHPANTTPEHPWQLYSLISSQHGGIRLSANRWESTAWINLQFICQVLQRNTTVHLSLSLSNEAGSDWMHAQKRAKFSPKYKSRSWGGGWKTGIPTYGSETSLARRK